MNRPLEKPEMHKAEGCEGCWKKCQWNHSRVAVEKSDGKAGLYGCNGVKVMPKL